MHKNLQTFCRYSRFPTYSYFQSLNMTSLFTKIPVDKALDIFTYLSNYVHNTYFIYNCQWWYHQIERASMALPLSPTYSSKKLNNEHYNNYHKSHPCGSDTWMMTLPSGHMITTVKYIPPSLKQHTIYHRNKRRLTTFSWCFCAKKIKHTLLSTSHHPAQLNSVLKILILYTVYYFNWPITDDNTQHFLQLVTQTHIKGTTKPKTPTTAIQMWMTNKLLVYHTSSELQPLIIIKRSDVPQTRECLWNSLQRLQLSIRRPVQLPYKPTNWGTWTCNYKNEDQNSVVAPHAISTGQNIN